jgi:tetratricopeptide (TPR) repeat protein
MNLQLPKSQNEQILNKNFIDLISLVIFFIATSLSAHSQSIDPSKVQELIRQGNYAQALDIAREQVEKKTWNETWPRILASTLLIQGKSEEALRIYETSLERFSDSMRLRLLGYQIYLENNLPIKAQQQLDELAALIQKSPWRYSAKSELIPLGEFFLLKKEDPKQVLKLCFDQALKADPKNIEAHKAIAKMAIDKSDFQVAADALSKAMKLSESDPELQQLAYQTWSLSDKSRAAKHLQKALEINPHHIPSLLLQSQALMDAENYSEALLVLEKIESINPISSQLWALRAAIAHLKNDFQNEAQFRSKALTPRTLNPLVDHTIGKHLSMHYRFDEGAKYQQRALVADPNFYPAQTQLAQDLLRLGNETQGWKMVQSAREADPFNVTNYNLQILKGELDKYTTIETPGFLIRMDKDEAKLFGKRVTQILSDARTTLKEKYRADIQEPIVVDLFAKQRDFAIRTFGLPGGEGFLGVCFGQVITANSPSALPVEHNWESVLWHEYCHVITLQLTANKMPRWLSEGISVYEEHQKKQGWGEPPQPSYLHSIRSGDFAPPSQLSAMFLAPSSPERLQFAYFISSWVVEFWIEQFGHDGLLALLEDIRNGLDISQAITRRSTSLQGFDQAFVNYAIARATNIAPELDLSPPSQQQPSTNPQSSYWSLHQQLDLLLSEEKLQDAQIKAQLLVNLWPEDPAPTSALRKLIAIERKLDHRTEERNALATLASIDPHDSKPLIRLIDLDMQNNDYQSVESWCNALLAITPNHQPTLNNLALSGEKLHKPRLTIDALLALSELDPIDPSDIFLRLALAYELLSKQPSGDPAAIPNAKRYCLKALEEAPRFDLALRLLQRLNSQAPAQSSTALEPTQE